MAVDVMMQLKDGKKTDSGPSSSSSTGSTLVPDGKSGAPAVALTTAARSSSNSSGTSKPSIYNEHRRIFGYQPSKVYSSKHTIKGKGKEKKKAVGTWTKEVICLKNCDQETSPSTEEKIELAQLNLGLRKLVFSAEGDANHVHDVICRSFPILECGGHTLMRVSENSRDLVAIEGPDGGVTVPFLKDILRQAKLYV